MATTYKVDGMTCGGCSGSVTKALARVGIEAVVSHEKATAVVQGEHDPTVVEKAVNGAGFEFKGVSVDA